MLCHISFLSISSTKQLTDKLPHAEWTHEAVAHIINSKIEERAVILRTKVQRDDHAKSLLDTLQNQAGKHQPQGKDGADLNKPKQHLNKKQRQALKQEKIGNGETPAAKQDNTPLTKEEKAARNKKKNEARKVRKNRCW